MYLDANASEQGTGGRNTLKLLVSQIDIYGTMDANRPFRGTNQGMPHHCATVELTDHSSLDHPVSLSLLLLELPAFLSAETTASALLHMANASTSSFIRRASTKHDARSEFLSATTDASSMHSSRWSRDKHVPTKCKVLTYASTVSGRYFCRKSESSASPSTARVSRVLCTNLPRASLLLTFNTC
jgi:hypothetical protein